MQRCRRWNRSWGTVLHHGQVLCQRNHRPYLTKKQGDYTLKDYYAFPEDYRIELIDGVIYNMTSPASAHQLIAGYIYNQLFNHITGKHGDCLPMISPIDVQLDCDNKTMVEPDVIVVCDRNKGHQTLRLRRTGFRPGSSLPSTKKKDMIVKLNKYMNAGVREYWMIDPDKKVVSIYDFEHEDYPLICGFEDNVTVSILDGQCQIDFRKMYNYISFLYED